MTSGEEAGCGEAAWEHTDQLYLLEVLVDEVYINKEGSWYGLDTPPMDLVGTVCFLSLPDMEILPNDLLLAGRRRAEQLSKEPLIPGLPEGWTVEEAVDLDDYQQFPQYRVSINVMSAEMKSFLVTLLVPRIAVDAGEGLRYTFTALERKLEPDIMQVLKEQIKAAVEKQEQKEDTETPIVFASGKSCLFQMTPYNLICSLARCPFYVLLYRQGVVDGLPVRHLVGKVKLELQESFTKAVTQVEGETALPVSAHFEDNVCMENLFGEESGTMGLFVRLSCFGCLVNPERPKVEAGPEVEEGGGCGRRPREAMMAADDAVLSAGACGWRASEERVPITWRRAEDRLPGEFRPRLAELMPALRAMPPPPPPDQPPADPWLEVTGLRRCSPGVGPPCYRQPGDPPVPPCRLKAEAQLRREEGTKACQTEPVPVVGRLPPTSPYCRT